MIEEKLAKRIEKHRNHHLYRQRKTLAFRQGTCASLKNQSQFVFCSNDYLGMAQHPLVIAEFKKAADRYGISGNSSFVVSGYTEAHQEFEQEFAKFLNCEAALLFSCGYMANLAVLSVLADRKTTVFADKLIHASLIDAIKLSQANLIRFPHCEYEALAGRLSQVDGEKLIVTDSVFSMLGDKADLPRLVQLASLYQTPLIVDDAHGIGVLGENGGGICEFYHLSSDQMPILVCPLAKALGVMGAMVVGSVTLIDALIQFARPYIYTNALPAPLAQAGLKSLTLLKEEKWRREKLQHLIAYFRQLALDFKLPVINSTTPIQSIIIGSSRKAQIISEGLRAKGFLLNSMRPPTVSETYSCLRVTLTSLHEEQIIFQLLQHIRDLYDTLS